MWMFIGQDFRTIYSRSITEFAMTLKFRLKFIDPGKINIQAFRREMNKAIKEQRDILSEDLDRITRTWEHDVKFKIDMKDSGDKIEGSISTDDEIFGYVEKGTRSHWVRPRHRGGVLAFRKNYRAKTRSGLIGSTQGGASGNTVFSRGHKVSGIKGREFLKAIYLVRQAGFKRRMQKAFEEASKNAWSK